VDEQLEVLLIRVKGGMGIDEALKVDKSHRWYYDNSKVSPAQRAVIRAARREYEERKKYPQGRVPQPGRHSGSFLMLEMPDYRKNQYQTICDINGVSMSQQTLSLINSFIGEHKSLL
jgi:hypothetical protein